MDTLFITGDAEGNISPVAHRIRGISRFNEMKYEDAVGDIREARSLAKPQLNTPLSQFGGWDSDEVQRNLRILLDESHYHLGIIFYNSGNWDDARREFATAYERFNLDFRSRIHIPELMFFDDSCEPKRTEQEFLAVIEDLKNVTSDRRKVMHPSWDASLAALKLRQGNIYVKKLVQPASRSDRWSVLTGEDGGTKALDCYWDAWEASGSGASHVVAFSLAQAMEYAGPGSRWKDYKPRDLFMDDVKSREAAERSLRIEQELKAIEVTKKEAERDNAKQIHAIEIDMQNAQDEKERTLAEARRTLDDYFRERQEEKDSYDHSQKLEEGKRRDEIFAMEEEAKRLVERAGIDHPRYLRDQELAAAQQELELANSRLAIAKIESDKTKLLGMVAAEVLESRTRAQNVLQLEEARAAAVWTERLIDDLPNLAEKISADDSGDKTVIYVGGDVEPESLGGAGGIVALSLAPVMKQLVGRISDFLTVQSYRPNGKENKAVPEEQSSSIKSQKGAARTDDVDLGTKAKEKAEQGH